MNFSTHILDQPLNRNKYTLLIFFVILELLVLYAFLQGSMVTVLIIIAGLLFLIFSSFSIERCFYLVGLYYFTIPEKVYSTNFPGWPIFFSWYLGLPLFLWLLINWFLYFMHNRIPERPSLKITRPVFKFQLRTMDKLLLIFIVAFSISAVLGFFRDFNRLFWTYNYVILLMYLGYFIFLYTPLSQKPRKLFDFVVLCTIIASFQYIYSVSQFGVFILLRRISSEHIHLTQMALPYLGVTILYASNKPRRILSALIFPAVLIGLLLCQQRSLYLSIFITLIILLLIFAYDKRHILFKNANRIIYGFLAIVLFLTVFYIVAQNITHGKLFTTVFARILVFLSPKMVTQDISAIVRVSEIKTALSSVGNDFLFGRGLGDNFISRWRDIDKNTVDNTFAFLYWQTGLVGLISFLIVIIYFLKRCINTLSKRLLLEEKILVLTSFLNFIGMLIVAMINVSLAGFRAILIWSATFAVVESIARKYEGKTSPNVTSHSQ